MVRTIKLKRTTRGFTLLELVVVATVASIIFLLLARWVLTLGEINNSTLTQASAARSTSYVDSRIVSDLGQATTCVNSNTMRKVDYRTVEFYIQGSYQSGGSGTYLVRYQNEGTLLTRTLYQVDPATGKCDPTGTSFGRKVLASGVRAATEEKPLFTADATSGNNVTCTPVLINQNDGTKKYEPRGAGCTPSNINVYLFVQPAGADNGHDILTRTYAVNKFGGSL